MRPLAVVLTLLVAAPVVGQPATLAVSHKARALQPGEAVVLRIASPVPLTAVTVSGVGRVAPAVRVMSAGEAGEVWQAVLGIDVEASSGPTTVRVEATTAARATLTADHVVTVAPKAFSQRRLRVAPQYVSPPAAVRARIEREAARLAAIYGTVTHDHLVTVPFARPVRHRLNSPFGVQSIYNGQVRGRHLGVDFASPAGAAIAAPAPGRVVLADDLYYTGQTLVIDHGQGVHTIFAHLRRIGVLEGARVATGDVVGEVGSTGRSSGPHLHWSLRVGGARVDPMSLVELE
jgi:murein DD-endopeptidase MepM/ murein hydrolase activator NlpD